MLLLYGISMYVSQKLTVTDPTTAQTQKTMNLVMPVMLTYMLWSWKLPCAIVLYWLCFNLLGLIQQAHIIRMPAAVLISDGDEPPTNPDTKSRGSKKR